MFIRITTILVYSFISLIGYIANAQEKSVRLVEEVQKKRTILYVQNNTETEKSVFLKVNPKGYRKSAQRPIIKKIPPKTKSQMMILIPLTDTISSYTYNLIVNDDLQTIELDANKNAKKEASAQAILQSENIIFTRKKCDECHALLTKLNSLSIDFKAVDLDTQSQYKTYLLKLLHTINENENTIHTPVAILKGKLIYPIEDIDKFILMLN